MSLPVALGREGIAQIISPSLDDIEIEAFKKAGSNLQNVAKEVGII